MNAGTSLARMLFAPSSMPPRSAPLTVPTPPTTARSTIGRLFTKSKSLGLTPLPASAPELAAMAAETPNASTFVAVRLMPSVAPAIGESLSATSRRPKRLRRSAMTATAKIAKHTDTPISRARGDERSPPGKLSAGTVRLPAWNVWRWLKTSFDTRIPNAAVASARYTPWSRSAGSADHGTDHGDDRHRADQRQRGCRRRGASSSRSRRGRRTSAAPARPARRSR